VADGQAGPAFDVRAQLRVVRRHLLLVTTLTALVIGITVAVTLVQPKTYRPRALVLVEPDGDASRAGSTSDPALAPRAVATEVQVAKSQPVRDDVSRRLGYLPRASVTRLASTDVIEIAVRGTDAARAADAANTWAGAYVDYRVSGARRSIEARLAQLQTRQADLSQELAALSTGEGAAAADAVTRRSILAGQLSSVGQQIDDLQVAAPLVTGGVEVIRPASAAGVPVTGSVARNLGVAIPFALVFAVALAFVRDYFEDSIETVDDVQLVTPDVPVIASIPRTKFPRKSSGPFISAHPRSAVADAFHGLRAALELDGLGTSMHVVQITSPAAHEGKTTVAANLSVAASRTGRRVVAVDLDLRRPGLHAAFGLPNDLGFVDVVRGRRAMADVLRPVPSENLLVVTAGVDEEHERLTPTELLASPVVRKLLHGLRAEADVVIIDTPPLLPVPDAAALSGVVDATVIIAASGHTTRRDLRRAVAATRSFDSRLAGLVLNFARVVDSYGYYASGREARVRRR
jgi:succinoglycan biosynthesis transport protein ExoP